MLRYNYTESNELGKRLRRVRKAAGMTLDDLAAALNKEYGTHANKGTISKYENGIHEPNASTIFCLSRILGVSVDYLMGRTDLDYPSLVSLVQAQKAAAATAEGKPAGKAAASAAKSAAPAAAPAEEAAKPEPRKPANYSYDMPDNSMSPHYRISDVLIFRTEMPLVSGQIYLVQYRKNKPIVRQVIIERYKWILKPENRAFDTLEIKLDPEHLDMPKDLRVFGRVIEFRRSEVNLATLNQSYQAPE
jgi:transcriptional regulator with XRE-family HTH domain